MEGWVRRRAHELGVVIRDLGMGPSELAMVLKDLDDSQLAPPFTEVKMWVGLDDSQDLSPPLAQLVMEFSAMRPLRPIKAEGTVQNGSPSPQPGPSPNANASPEGRGSQADKIGKRH